MSSTASSSAQMGVSWVPTMEDHLLTWAADVKLYRVQDRHIDKYPVSPPANVGFRISDWKVAEVEYVLPDPPHYIKCVEVHPRPYNPKDGHLDIHLAIGLANGRIVLRSFNNNSAKELSPRTMRPCSGLHWSPLAPHNLLAAGLDRARGDGGVHVFDAESSPTTGTVFNASVQNRFFGAREETGQFVKAIHEFAVGEACNSLQWLKRENPTELMAGIGGKNLKIFDLRSSDKKQHQGPTTHATRAVYGVCVDPKLEYRLASYYDNQVMFWDTRCFDKPILTQEQHLKVTKIEWCPTRHGLLCSSAENSVHLSIHEIQAWSLASSTGEPAITERRVKGWAVPPTAMEALAEPLVQEVAKKPERLAAAVSALTESGKRSKHSTGQQDEEHSPFSAFSWHPTDETAIIAVSKNGKLSAVEVTERISPSWSSSHRLTWAHGGKLITYAPDVNQDIDETTDISVIMQKRVPKNYGSLTPLRENGEIVASYHPSCATAWNWLDHCETLMKDLTFKNAFSKTTTIPGVRTAVNRMGIASDITYQTWNVNESKNLRPKTVYRSIPRQLTQRMCGWGFHVPEDRIKFCENCARRGEYTRAAAVAAFCLEMKAALDMLARGAKHAEEEGDKDMATKLTYIRMALAGYSETKESEWRKTVRESVDGMTDPYSRALFAFLASNEGDLTFASVLDEDGIYMSDKVAFASQYLSDERLTALVNNYWNDYKERGDLVGLVLSGMEEESLHLLQKYLDLSGDVQTVAWLSVRCMGTELAKSPQPQDWFHCYGEILNSWRFWMKRAEFEVFIGDACMFKKAPQQVYLSCSFCGAPTTPNLNGIPSAEEVRMANMDKEARSKQTKKQTSMSETRLPPSACRSCKKPLPRCAICLRSIGTESGRHFTVEPPSVEAPLLTPFDHFPAWCQQCRHGGHAGHIDAWFEDHRLCPVTGCNCRCMDLDMEDCRIMEEPDLSKSNVNDAK